MKFVPRSTPIAIGRSSAGPSFFTSAGARLISIAWAGNAYPELIIARRTRSIDSFTAVCGKADHRGFAQPALADIHFDFAEQRVDAHEDEAMYFCEH